MNLDCLKLDEKIIKKLKDNGINSVETLWNISKNSLKELNFNYDEINTIKIKLQLNGLDLNKKKYTK